MDSIRCAHVEDACKKENGGDEHRPDSEANRGRDTAKGIQFGIAARLASVKSRIEFAARSAHR